MRYRTGLILLVGALLLAPALPVRAERTAGPWPQWRGPNRNGLSSETDLNTDWKKRPPELVWMTEGMGSGYASVSVVGNRLYTTGNTNGGQAVIAVDVEDGKVLWTTPLTGKAPKHGYDGSRCTPSVDGDRLYAVTSDGAIACLKTNDGELVWQRKFKEFGGKMMSGWGFSESPLVDGDWVLCTPGGETAMIVALNKMSGETVWKAAMPAFDAEEGLNGKQLKDGAGYASIVVSNGGGVKQYVTLAGRGAIGVRASDGKFLWRYGDVANGTANIPTPIVDGDYVFASSGYGTGALLKLSPSGDGVKATEVYFLDAKTFQNHHGGMLLVDGHVYSGHNHGKGFPICVELATGKVVWGGDIRGEGSGSAAVTYGDGHIIFRYQSGEVALVEATPDGYRLKGSFKPAFQKGKTWAHPVIADGKLYLREQEKLMCYRLK